MDLAGTSSAFSMNRDKLRMAWLLAFIGAFSHALGATATGTIAGIADPGAEIVVTNLDNGQTITTFAREDGVYRVERLKPGRYQVEEMAPHAQSRTLVVSAGADARVDLLFLKPKPP
jgi:hypothetical protein